MEPVQTAQGDICDDYLLLMASAIFSISTILFIDEKDQPHIYYGVKLCFTALNVLE